MSVCLEDFAVEKKRNCDGEGEGGVMMAVKGYPRGKSRTINKETVNNDRQDSNLYVVRDKTQYLVCKMFLQTQILD